MPASERTLAIAPAHAAFLAIDWLNSPIQMSTPPEYALPRTMPSAFNHLAKLELPGRTLTHANPQAPSGFPQGLP